MMKGIGVSVIVLALTTSSFAAPGDIMQGQEWYLGLGHTVSLTQGVGVSTSSHSLGLFESQPAGNIGLGTWGVQTAGGGVSETGTVAGNNINGTADQSIVMDGLAADGNGQVQNVTASTGAIGQTQAVGVATTQDLAKEAGPGVVVGTHGVSLMMSQAGGSVPSGSSVGSLSVVNGTQESVIAGGPSSVGTVAVGMTAITVQVQLVN